MRRIIILSALILMLTTSAFGQATNWNVNARPNSDWFSSLDSYRNVPLMWMRAIDVLIQSGGNVPGTGSTFYVDSNVANAGDGTSWLNAKATLDEAVALCTDDNGDIIYVAQGHIEDWATTTGDDVDVDISGVTIIGCGQGETRPLFTADDKDGEFVIGEDSVLVANLRFRASIDSTVSLFVIEADADGFIVYRCEFMEPESASAVDEADDIMQVAAGANQGFIVGCTFYSLSAGANTAIDLTAGVIEDITIAGNYINGDWAEAGIYSDDTDLRSRVIGNTVISLNATGRPIDFGDSATGWLIDNICQSKSTSYLIDPGAMQMSGNLWSDTDTSDTQAVPMFITETGVDIWAASQVTQLSGAATTAIEAGDLDHLISAADGDDPYNGSIIADLAASDSTSDWSGFDNTTDSLEAISDKITALEGVNFMATATGAGSTSTFVSTDGGDGFGNDFFNSGWSLIITYDADSAGAQPEGDVRDITDYVSSSGTFTVAPVWSNTQSTATGDKAIVVRHEDLDDYASATHGGSGKIIYVDASQPGTPEPTGDIGKIWDLSYTTIAAALVGATANNGDIILVAAGHTETVANAQLTWNVAGVRIIGCGVGSTMPIINLNHANASIDVTAADVYLANFRIRTTEDDVLIAIDLADTADGFHIKNCIFDAGTATDEFLETIEFKAAAVANVTIESCQFYADDTADATEAIISEVGASDNTKIIGNTFIGSWVVAPVYFSQAHTNMLVKDNVIQNFQTGQCAFEATVGCTGIFADNTMHGDTIGSILDPGSLMCTGNTGSISINEAGVTLPLSADTTGVSEAADGSNLERLDWLQVRSDDILASLGRDTVADNVWFVDSVADVGGTGVSWATSEKTLKAAIDNVVSDVDSIIFVASKHTEEFTASIAMNAPGVRIIGLGESAARPIFTFNNTAAALTHTVADVCYENCVFQCTTADSTVGVSLDGSSDGAKFTNCEWLSTTEFEFLSMVTLASACDDVEFHGCKFNNLTSGVGDATAAITTTAGVVDGLVVDDCEFYGTWSVAAIYSDDADTDVIVKDNIVRNMEPGAFGIEFTGAALGSCVNNMIYTDSYGIGLDPGSLGCFGNKHSYGTDTAAIDTPLIAGHTYTLMANQASVTATTDPLFAIAGGPIKITNFFGIVSSVIGASDIKIQGIDTETDTTFPYTTSVTCDDDAAGTTYTFTGAVPSVLTPVTGGNTNLSTATDMQWYAVPGTIDQLGDAAVVGVIDWYMTFIPLAPGVVVTDDS